MLTLAILGAILGTFSKDFCLRTHEATERTRCRNLPNDKMCYSVSDIRIGSVRPLLNFLYFSKYILLPDFFSSRLDDPLIFRMIFILTDFSGTNGCALTTDFIRTPLQP